MEVQMSSLPEIVVQSNDEEKQIVHRRAKSLEKEAAGAEGKQVDKTCKYDWLDGEGYIRSHSKDGLNPTARRRRASSWMWIAAALLVVFGIGLGAGLGVGLGSDHKASSDNENVYFSTRGAFNGTGLKAKGSSDGDSTTLTLSYQHYSGDIRYMKLAYPALTQLPVTEPIIAVDARNGTPIRVTQTTAIGSQQQHVFYVGQDGMVKERMIDDINLIWTDGPLTSQNITTLRSNDIGLHSAFYAGPILNYDSEPTEHKSGVRVWIPRSETTFDQMAWRPGLSKWIYEQSWQGMNGHVTPVSNDNSDGNTTYIMFLNGHNKPELYWRDATSNVESTGSHPINLWSRVDIDFATADPSTNLFRGIDWYARIADSGDLPGWNLDLSAENSTVASNLFPILAANLSIPTSKFDAEQIPPERDPHKTLVFCQTEGDDITVFSASLGDTTWVKTRLSLPDA